MDEIAVLVLNYSFEPLHFTNARRAVTLLLSVTDNLTKKKAELKRDQVLAYGPDPRMSVSKGPLGCYIEPAPSD